METEVLFQRVREMIISSTKKPKYTGVSSVKLANLFESSPGEIEEGLQKLIKEGRLRKEVLEDPPYYDIYLLP
jgi:hypothetical protein